jgi:hypothetical protein
MFVGFVRPATTPFRTLAMYVGEGVGLGYETRCFALEAGHDIGRLRDHKALGRWAEGTYEWVRGEARPKRRALPSRSERLVVVSEHWQQARAQQQVPPLQPQLTPPGAARRGEMGTLANFPPQWALRVQTDVLGNAMRGASRRWWGVPVSQTATASRQHWDRSRIATHTPYALAHVPIHRDFPQ